MYLVCTRYVVVCSRKNKKNMCIILGFDPWISCIAYCVQHRSAASVHSTVILLVDTRYIFSKIYTGVAQYLLSCVTSGAGPTAPPALAMTSLVRT